MAMGRPSVIGSSVPTSSTDDQIVVSVGPYMLSRRPRRCCRTWSARDAGRASPPSIRTSSFARASAAPGSARSRCAADGVICRWLTPCRSISSARLASAASVLSLALLGTSAARTSASKSRLASTSPSATPKSIKQATSSTPRSARSSKRSRHVSGGPNKPDVSK